MNRAMPKKTAEKEAPKDNVKRKENLEEMFARARKKEKKKMKNLL